jgi:hypothetical protein
MVSIRKGEEMIIYAVVGSFEYSYNDKKQKFKLEVRSLNVEKETDKTYSVSGSMHHKRILKSEMDRLIDIFGSEIGYYCLEENLEVAKSQVINHIYNKLFNKKREIEDKMSSVREYELEHYPNPTKSNR